MILVFSHNLSSRKLARNVTKGTTGRRQVFFLLPISPDARRFCAAEKIYSYESYNLKLSNNCPENDY